jgi:hypothetical protein
LSRLILFPKDPLLQLPLEPLLELLLQQQVVESLLDGHYGERSYLLGERFFDAFLFLGCSPSIELAPTAADTPFCYLELESEVQCRLISGSNLKAACKGCKQRYGELPQLEAQQPPDVSCCHCGAVYSAEQIAWRKTAALAKTRFSLWNIFEGEAVPSDQLLGMLQKQSGVEWSYAYINS